MNLTHDVAKTLGNIPAAGGTVWWDECTPPRPGTAASAACPGPHKYSLLGYGKAQKPLTLTLTSVSKDGSKP